VPNLLAYPLTPSIFALLEAGYAVVWQDCRGRFRSRETSHRTRTTRRYDRNTNAGGVIAQDTADQAVVATNSVLHGPGHPSRLIPPVIRR
jgi:predicted acyl esterase